MRTAASLLYTCLYALCAYGQSTATIVGIARDASGAVVPGALVRVVNIQTGLVRTQTTGDGGLYTMPLLPVGEYRLEVEKAGFGPYSQTGITLAVNDRVSIDATLTVGALSASVTVNADAPLLETQSGTIRGVVDQQRIVNLPLNGRNVTQLLSIQAGVIPQGGSFQEGNAFVVNGSRARGVYYTLDGGANVDSYQNWSGLFPNPDAIQEFSVQKSNFSAEFGNASGAVVSALTKSGTNSLHGSAFEFVRNAQLNARNFFAARRDPLKRNQFGGTLGGPILRDKLFFFFSYQDTSIRSDPGLTKQFLPTAAMRGGDFSGVSQSVKDPLTGSVFPGNRIPASRLSSVTQAFLKYLPTPATADGSRLTGYPLINDVVEYTGKVDWEVHKHRISGRYFYTRLDQPFTGNLNDYATMYQSGPGKSTVPYQQWTANDTYTIAPSIINNFTFAYRHRRTFNDWTSVTLPLNYQQAGVKGVSLTKSAMVYLNVTGAFTARPGWNYDKQDTDLQFSDVLYWLTGRHEIKIGGEVLRVHSAYQVDFRVNPIFAFDGSASNNATADFMLGNAYSFDQGGGSYRDLSGTRPGVFIQDNFRVRPALTLNLGLRWDPMLPYTDNLARMQCFVPGAQSTRFQNAPLGYLSGGDAGCPAAGMSRYFGQLAPRFGFAWNGKAGTVVRGGFGLFYNPQFGILFNGFNGAAPFSPQVTFFGVRLEDPFAGRTSPYPAGFAPFDPPQNSAFLLPLGAFGSFTRDFRPSYQETYNLTVERPLMANTVGRVTYIGNLGRRLSYNQAPNYARYVPGASTAANIPSRRLYKDFGNINLTTSSSTSSYHGMQVSVERRMSGNLSFEANYTFSKSIDEISTDITPENPNIRNPLSRAANRGLSDFNNAHRIVLSYVYELPRLAHSGRAVRAIAGGWQSSGVVTVRSGFPFGVNSGTDRSSSGINADAADLIGNPFLDAGRSRAELIAAYFSTAAFAAAAPGTFGTASRNLLTGPGAATFDLSASKSFRIHEKVSGMFRAEFFNAFNKPNFNNPVNSVSSGVNRFGKIEGAADPRIIQLSMKISF